MRGDVLVVVMLAAQHFGEITSLWGGGLDHPPFNSF